MRMKARHVPIRSPCSGYRSTRSRTRCRAFVLRPPVEDEEVDVVAHSLAYALDPAELRQLLLLFGPIASKQELLANMRRPSRMR